MHIINISRPSHIESTLYTHQITGAKPKDTTMEANANITLMAAPVRSNADLSDVTAYQSGLGQLMLLVVRTRLGNLLEVRTLSAFVTNPRDRDWMAMKRVLTYPAGVHNRGTVQ